jgi:dTDP-glucose 4,6-dehydratase
MRVLVAGGGGFIGSHLTDYLLTRGDEVVVVDDFSTGRRSNLAHLTDDVRVAVVEHDVTDRLPDLGAFEAVVNLASPASPDDFARIPLAILEVGSVGTRRLLDLASRSDARFLQASSSEVYGDSEVHPQPEDYVGHVDPIGPRSCYDEAKRFGEALVMAHHRVHGTDGGIARIFNTYGERMAPTDGRVVNTFIVQALRGEPLSVHGDGSQTRSFCHVSDQVAGLAALLDHRATGPVNIGNPVEFTVLSLAELVIEMTGSTSRIESVALPVERTGDPAQRCPDIAMARSLLGWEPTVTLREGLAGMIDHFRSVESIA